MATGCQLLFSSDDDPPPRNDNEAPLPPVEFKVVILVIDGVRYSESFGDPFHSHVPRMWNDLRPLGTIYESFRNEGVTNTVPGHAAMLTGRWLDLANDGTEPPGVPTIFENFRLTQDAPEADAAIVGGKQKLTACAYSSHPSYGPDYGAYIGTHTMSDEDAYDTLLAVLSTHHPRLVMASFSDTDRRGHAGDWFGYLAQIEAADELVWSTWNYLQSDPYYAGETFLFVTTDHGRHDDQHGGFESHGCSCEGCRRLFFLALGPGVRQDYVVPANYLHTQRDLCETIGDLLDFPTPYSEGKALTEMFEPVTGIKAATP
jgi:hypothetical protein